MKKFVQSHITISLLAVSLVLIGVGIIVGEHKSVLQKSILICLECIGIG